MHLYLHVPFCARRCSYCDFAIAVRPAVPSDEYARLVLREWEIRSTGGEWEGAGPLETIYFGGGTPSRLDPAAIGQVLDGIRGTKAVRSDAEITLEANPDDVTRDSAAAWRIAGVNRISLGVQSFDDRVLQWMHRTHDSKAPARAMEFLRRASFDNISLDLIFGLDQSLDRSWDSDLDRALDLMPEHLSFYGLTVEAHTPLARWVDRGRARVADEERYAAEFLRTHERLAADGFEHYEVSSAGLPGRRSRHNFAYWKRRPFLGLGPSAHSARNGTRTWNIREWAAWRDAMLAGEPAVAGTEVLDAAAVRLEQIYLGLRTREGVAGSMLPAGVAETWRAEGWAEPGDPVRLTAEGWLRLDALIRATFDTTPPYGRPSGRPYGN